MTRDLDGAGDDADDAVDEAAWTSAERALLEAALDFYGAAGGVLDYTGRERPQLRRGEGFEAIRKTMALLEQRVVSAHAAGTSRERIAQITRIEPETIAAILERRDGAAPSPAES